MGCDLCGREEDLINAIIEGTMVSVCNNCSEYGSVVEIKKADPRTIIKRESRHYLKEDEIKFVKEDYGVVIRKARDRKGLTQEELAQSIAEKSSIIHKIESGQFEPTLQIAKKLEQFFGIKLIDESLDEIQKVAEFKGTRSKINIKDESLTIGDLIKPKKEDDD